MAGSTPSSSEQARNVVVVWRGKPVPVRLSVGDKVKEVIEGFLDTNTSMKRTEAKDFQLRRLVDRLNALDPDETVQQNGIQDGDMLLLTSSFPHRQTDRDKFVAAGVIVYSLVVMGASLSVLLSIWPKDLTHLPVNGTGAINLVIGGSYTFPYNTESLLLLVMLLAGITGACIYSLYAVSLHLGAYRDFDGAWTAWYVLRPPIGAGLSFILYLLVRSGIITVSGVPQDLNLIGVAGLSAFVGLYTEHVVHKLHNVADEIFGTGPGDSSKGKDGDGQQSSTAPQAA